MSWRAEEARRKAKREAKRRTRMRRQALTFVLSVMSFGLLLNHMADRLTNPSHQPTRTWIDGTTLAEESFTTRCGPGFESPVVTVVHSPEKVAWLERGAETFMHMCPNVRVRLIARPDYRAIVEIESGELEPSLWLPSDDIFADYLEEGWALGELEQSGELERGPSLLRTPMVLLMWADRARALEELWPGAQHAPQLVAELVCAAVPHAIQHAVEGAGPGSWSEWSARVFAEPRTPPSTPSEQTLRAWGSVETVHTLPNTSTGTMTLLAMAHGYLGGAQLGPASAEEFEDALDLHSPDLRDWLRRCEGPREDFVGPPRRLSQRMFQKGPEGFDGILVYEHLALEVLGKGARMQVIYPHSMLVPNHPVVFFPRAELPSSRRYVEFMRSAKMKNEAIRLGFRPGDRDLAVRDAPLAVGEHPIVELREFGVRLNFEAFVDEPPRLGRDSLRELLELWEDATGRK